MIPAASNGSLYEFQKLPYNPATPRRTGTILETTWLHFRRFFFLIQFMFKSIPIWIELTWQWLNPPAPKSIAGWTALVTGGSNGIGKAVSLELAKFGCNVIIADIDEENGPKVARELTLKYRVRAGYFKTDVADYEAIVELERKIRQNFGQVDLLVNNAGVLPFMVPDEYSPENIRRMMDVNVLSHFWTTKVFLPSMYHRDRGHIVGIVSRSAYTPTGYMRNYATSKYALRGFMEDLHDEIYHAGFENKVVTTSVFPVLINTRKEVMERYLELPGFENMSPNRLDDAGKAIVQAIRTNKRKLFVPDILKPWQVALFEDFPRKITRLLVRELFK
ncbi:uncharacterized oxidoreductase SSP0419-like [Armigeres subalbatus]|uniref:uncharacterized oxidoreductase SSP0419-like n=1 Tax=Armigeres subalbatus TaxID=124917 RepID=UPI002ED318AA